MNPYTFLLAILLSPSALAAPPEWNFADCEADTTGDFGAACEAVQAQKAGPCEDIPEPSTQAFCKAIATHSHRYCADVTPSDRASCPRSVDRMIATVPAPSVSSVGATDAPGRTGRDGGDDDDLTESQQGGLDAALRGTESKPVRSSDVTERRATDDAGSHGSTGHDTPTGPDSSSTTTT